MTSLYSHDRFFFFFGGGGVILVDYQTGLWEKYLVTEDWSQSTGPGEWMSWGTSKNSDPDSDLNHYESTPIQIYWKFYHKKKRKNSDKNSDIFRISAQNIDCGYSFEPPWWGGSNEYPQSIFFWGEIRKIMYTPVNPSLLHKSGV